MGFGLVGALLLGKGLGFDAVDLGLGCLPLAFVLSPQLGHFGSPRELLAVGTFGDALAIFVSAVAPKRATGQSGDDHPDDKRVEPEQACDSGDHLQPRQAVFLFVTPAAHEAPDHTTASLVECRDAVAGCAEVASIGIPRHR